MTTGQSVAAVSAYDRSRPSTIGTSTTPNHPGAAPSSTTMVGTVSVAALRDASERLALHVIFQARDLPPNAEAVLSEFGVAEIAA